MSPHDFLDQVVRPNLLELSQSPGSMRHAFNAICSVDALAAHIYEWLVTTSTEGSSASDDTAYRDNLAKADHAFALARDVAKAQKHVVLRRGKPLLSGSSDVRRRRLGSWGESWGDSFGNSWGGTTKVYVHPKAGQTQSALDVAQGAMSFLENEMVRLGIPTFRPVA